LLQFDFVQSDKITTNFLTSQTSTSIFMKLFATSSTKTLKFEHELQVEKGLTCFCCSTQISMDFHNSAWW